MFKRTNFYLIRPKKGVPSAIMAKVQYKNVRVEMVTGEHCKPEHWNKTTRRPDERFADFHPDYAEVTRVLNEFDSFAVSTYNAARRKRELLQLTPERFKKILRGHLDGVDYGDDMTTVDYYRHHLEKLAGLPDRIRPSGKSMSSYHSDLTYFVQFSNSLPHHPVLAEGNFKLMEMFRDYLFTLPQDLAESTVFKLLKRFKNLYRNAAKEGLTEGTKVLTVDVAKDLGLSEKPATKIALYLPEIEYLADFDLTEWPHLAATRDLFVFAAVTGGLRYDNWQDITAANIHETPSGKELRTYTRKGAPKLIVAPFHPLSYRIAERLNYQFPASLTNQGTNRNLKELCKIVGFTETVRIEQLRGAGLVIEQKPKYDLIRTHTARRTYATILYDGGMALERIVELMTHTDAATTKRYIKEDQARKSARLAALPFFNK